MQIKLTWFRLDNHSCIIKPGMQVCPSNGAGSVGVVVDVSREKHEDSWKHFLPATVTVLWGTGKKRGKKMEHPPENLVDFDRYLAAVRKEFNTLTELESESKSLGM